MTMAVSTGMFEQIEFLSGRASQVPGQAHALMEDAHHTDAVRVDTVDDDMRANQAGAVCGRQVLSAAACLRVVGDGLQGRIQLVTVDQQLFGSPGLTCIAQDVDEVLSGSGG